MPSLPHLRRPSPPAPTNECSVTALVTFVDDGTWERLLGRDEADHPVVVKAPHRIGDAAIDALRAEAAVLSTVDHPGVPRLVGFCGVDGRPGLVSRPGDVTTLAERLADNPADPGQIIGMARDVADLLVALWQAGWVVDRLEPSDLHVTTDGVLVLGDLGAVRRRSSSGPPGSVLAPAPEADAGLALGRLLLQVLDGAAPGDDRQREIITSVANRLADPVPARRAELTTAIGLLERMGAVPTPLAGSRTLDGCAAPAPAGAGPEPAAALPAPSTQPEVRRRGARRSALLALAATALCTFGVHLVLDGASPEAEPTAPRPCPISGDLALDGGATSLAADVDGSGCTVSIHWYPDDAQLVVVHPSGLRRYGLGLPGDTVTVADWDCDGIATPALARPGGGAWRFDAWPTSADPGTATEINPDALAHPPTCGSD